MVMIRSCCFWQTVRRGSYASGLYTLIYFVISSVSISLLLHKERAYVMGDQEVGNDPREKICPAANVIFNIMILTSTSFGVITSIVLLFGIYKNRRHLFLPWISVMVIDIFVEFSHFLYALIFERVDQKMATMLLFSIDLCIILLHIYCLLCVVSQYHELKSSPPSHTVNANDVLFVPTTSTFAMAPKNCQEDIVGHVNYSMKNIKKRNDLKYIEDIIPWSEHEYCESC